MDKQEKYFNVITKGLGYAVVKEMSEEMAAKLQALAEPGAIEDTEDAEDALGAGFDHCVVTHGILRNGQPATVDICLDCEDEFDFPLAKLSDYRGVVERGHYGTCEHPLHPVHPAGNSA